MVGYGARVLRVLKRNAADGANYPMFFAHSAATPVPIWQATPVPPSPQ
jgi:hypothetical protein